MENIGLSIKERLDALRAQIDARGWLTCRQCHQEYPKLWPGGICIDCYDANKPKTDTKKTKEQEVIDILGEIHQE